MTFSATLLLTLGISYVSLPSDRIKLFAKLRDLFSSKA
jgi:hypothetical protein